MSAQFMSRNEGQWIWVLLAVLALSGCASSGSSDQDTAAAENDSMVIDLDIEPFIPSTYGQRLTESDRIKQAEATAVAVTGDIGESSVDWNNADTGAKGEVTAGPVASEVRTTVVDDIGGIELINAQYRAEVNSNVRSGPANKYPVVDGLKQGEVFHAVGKARGTDWVLVARNGKAIGFVYGNLVESVQATKMGGGIVLENVEVTIRCRDVQREARTRDGNTYSESGRYCTDAVNVWRSAPR